MSNRKVFDMGRGLAKEESMLLWPSLHWRLLERDRARETFMREYIGTFAIDPANGPDRTEYRVEYVALRPFDVATIRAAFRPVLRRRRIMIVLAGNYHEYLQFLRNEGIQPADARYISAAEDLRGLSHDEVELRKIGTWWRHPCAGSNALQQFAQQLEQTAKIEGSTTACSDCGLLVETGAVYESVRDPNRLLCESCFHGAERGGRARERQPVEPVPIRLDEPAQEWGFDP